MKRVIILLMLSATLLALITSVGATCEEFSWYCKHVKNEEIPPIDASFSFIGEYGGIYIDKDASSENKTVYLTFDAGYENGNVAKVLDVLKEKNAVGAFFILKNLAERNPELVRRMSEEGHIVCNHTASHRDMSKVASKEEFMNELESLNAIVKEKTGVTVSKYFRPPEGRFSKNDLVWADEEGYKTVFWSFAYADWDNNNQMSKDNAIKKIIDGAHPGEILLLHPTSSTNAEILGEVIDKFREMGYTFKSLEEIA